VKVRVSRAKVWAARKLLRCNIYTSSSNNHICFYHNHHIFLAHEALKCGIRLNVFKKIKNSCSFLDTATSRPQSRSQHKQLISGYIIKEQLLPEQQCGFGYQILFVLHLAVNDRNARSLHSWSKDYKTQIRISEDFKIIRIRGNTPKKLKLEWIDLGKDFYIIFPAS